MLGVSKYERDYIEHCRAAFAAHVAAFDALAKVSRPGAMAALEPHFFNALLIALDGHFVHRLRGVEKKDGNPLNEVRMLCASLMSDDGVLQADDTIKYDPAKSVLKYKPGDRIVLTRAQFAQIAPAFLAEIESRFT